MADTTVFMKRNDTQPFLDVKLKDNVTDYADLAVSGIGVTFTMVNSDTEEIKVNKQDCQIIDPVTGAVRYVWQLIDTDTEGSYLAEFEVTHPAIPPYPIYKLTYPIDGVLAIVILGDYDDA